MCLIVVMMCTVWIIFLLPRMRHICVGASGIRAGRSGTVSLRLKGSLPGLPLADDGTAASIMTVAAMIIWKTTVSVYGYIPRKSLVIQSG